MRKTLLLADDSVVIQKLVGLSFANEEVDLVTTDNGDDALTRAREVRPDLVLADVVMPGKNGYEVCQAIKSDPDLAGTPVLLLTGTFEAFDEDRARAVGSDGHITKPFEAQGLVDRVTDLLSRPRPAAAPTPSPAVSAPPMAGPPISTPVEPDASLEVPVPAASASPADDTYDFFDDEVQELAAPEPVAPAPPAPTIETSDAFAFGEDLDPLSTTEPASAESDTLDTNFELDSDEPVDLPVGAATDGPLSPTAPPPIPSFDAPDATRVELGEPVSAARLEMTPPAVPIEGTARTTLADDLFADTNPAAQPGGSQGPPALPAPGVAAARTGRQSSSDFEFGVAEPPATANPAVADGATPEPTAAEPMAVSSPVTTNEMLRDDSSDPLAGMRSEVPNETWQTDLPEAPAVTDAAESTHSGYDVSMSDLGDPLAGTEPAISAPTSEPEPSRGEQSAPDLSPVMRSRIHETLEKVAWEAFADLSDSIVRQVIQRVESIVWEVVPQMAEALIQEEIRRMKGDD